MRIVQMTRDLRPWAKGQDAVVPDGVAQKLLKDGDAADSRPFPPPDVAPAVPVGPTRPQTKRGYMTRKRG
jgi:hypothetical protein